MPAISVVMPVYNSAAYIRDAVESILQQRFTDFEFLILNDGSTDATAEIIKSYTDPRIRLIEFEANQGYATLLNLGMDESTGKYIARMDSDDIALPDRLGGQYKFLEQHPEYVVCGSRYAVLGVNVPVALPLEDEEIRLKLLYLTPFCHPSVMMRSGMLKDNKIRYDPHQTPAEDHELWVKLSDIGKFRNLPEVLLLYRIHQNNVSLRVRTKQQEDNLIRAQTNYIQKFFKEVYLSDAEAALLQTLFFNHSFVEYGILQHLGELLQRIIAANFNYPVPRRRVHTLLITKFHYCCTLSTANGYRIFSLANRYSFMNIGLFDNMKLLVKSMARYKPTA